MYNVQHIHLDSSNCFSGIVGFLVDNRLFTIHFITPLFNDFKEFRITSAHLSQENYQPETNTIELFKSSHIPDFVISQKELDFLDLYFNYDYVNNYKYQSYVNNEVVYSNQNLNPDNLKCYIDTYGEEPLFPFDYLNPDDFCSATLLNIDNTDNGIVNNDFLTLFVPIKRNKCDYFDSKKININEWTNVPDITHRLGLFNFFVPILKGLLKI